MQLFSFEQQKSQPLEAHAAGFASVKVCACTRRTGKKGTGAAATAAAQLEEQCLQPDQLQHGVAEPLLQAGMAHVSHNPMCGSSNIHTEPEGPPG